MTRNSKRSLSIEDVDDVSDQTPDEFGEVLEAEFADDVPMPEETGKSLVALIAAWLGGLLLSFMTAKGMMTPDQAAEFAPAITVAVVAGVAWVTQRYIKGRAEVKIAALHASARVQSARAGMSLGSGASMRGGLSLESIAGILASLSMMVPFLPISSTAKTQVKKALNAAITALSTYQTS